MKTKLFLFATALFFSAVKVQAQDATMPVNSETKLIDYTEVVTMSGIKKDELYKRGLAWFNKNYKNPAAVIKKQSPEEGIIEGVHLIKVYNTDKEGKKLQAGEIGYTITILFKDDKYKYSITKLNQKGASYKAIEPWMDKSAKGYLPVYGEHLKQVDEFAKNLVNEIKKGMNDAGAVKKSDF
jgi:hypothetical protein